MLHTKKRANKKRWGSIEVSPTHFLGQIWVYSIVNEQNLRRFWYDLQLISEIEHHALPQEDPMGVEPIYFALQANT